MKILGIDTSTKTMSMGITDGEKLVGEVNFYSNMDHSEKIMDNLTYLLNSTDTVLEDIDAISVAVGPGSFTGIRIAIATVKGLSEFRDIPVIPISSLKVVAENISRGVVAVAIDAKRDRVYGYIVNQDTKEVLLDEDLYSVEDFSEYLTEDMILITDTKDSLAQGVPATMREHINSAYNLCKLGLEDYDTRISHLELKANYMTKSQAQLQREQRQGDKC